MIIAQISDTHLLSPRTAGEQAARRHEDLERTVAHLGRLDPQPDVVLHTGDVAHNGALGEYDLARTAFKPLAMPLFPIVGNRDRRQPFLAAFGARIGLDATAPFVQYAVDLGPLRLVAADTLSLSAPVGEVCPERLAGLEALLDEAPDEPTVLMLHHPPVEVPGMRNPFHFSSQESAVRLQELVARHLQITRVFAGHTHRADGVQIGPVQLSTAPSIATELRKDRYSAEMATTPVYQVHVLDPMGGISSRTEIVT